VSLDPAAAGSSDITAEKATATAQPAASSPKVIRTDLEVGKSLAPPVSV
jgi:hypothetical protein